MSSCSTSSYTSSDEDGYSSSYSEVSQAAGKVGAGPRLEKDEVQHFEHHPQLQECALCDVSTDSIQ